MQPLMDIHSWRITISIGVVSRWASSGDVVSARRLGKLPDLGKTDSTVSAARRLAREDASRRGRTGIVGDEVYDPASTCVLANVVGGDDGCAMIFFGGNAGAVYSGAKTGSVHAINPGIDIGFLLRQHASALLLVEKDDGVSGESLAVCSGDSGSRVGFAECSGAGNSFQIGIQPAIEQQQKSESRSFQFRALPDPCVRARAWRAV